MSGRERATQRNAGVLHDAGDGVKSWGRRGILAGGIAGFAFGAIFVAIPFTSDVLTFGIAGTLIVAAVEGAVIAGAFAACAAALYRQGTIRHQFGRPGLSSVYDGVPRDIHH